MAENLGMTESTLAASDLFAGESSRPEVSVTILSGSGKLSLGTVLGRILKGTGAIAAVAGNTGNGAAGAVTVGKKAKVGVYKLKCITAASNAGVFSVFDPDGYRMADLTVAVAYDNGHFAVTIADGSADFIVGDSFTVTIAAGSRKCKAYDDDNTDGSDDACLILGRDVDATSADVKAFAYAGGEFLESALTGIDAAGKIDLELHGIFVK
jgi:hypothetical protein